MSERRFDDFDSHAANYRELHNKNIKLTGADSLYFSAFKVKELRRFEEDRPAVLLDLGCGDGSTEIFLEKYFPSVKVEAIDVSKTSIEEANKKKLNGVTFTVYDGQTLPFEDAFFDMVMLATVLHHIAFHLHGPLLKEIWRVLKPGGRIYIYEHNPFNPFTRYLVSQCPFDKDARLLTHRYCSKLVAKEHFKQGKIHFLLFFPRSKWFSAILKIERGLTWLPLGAQYLCRAVK